MEFDINGEEPNIIGKNCQGLRLIQLQEGSSITDPANTTYLNFENTWFKLYFDGGTIFWRSAESPSEPVNNNLSSCLVLLNLSELDGVVGYTLENIEYTAKENTVSSKLIFSGGKALYLIHNCNEDFTTINC